MDTLALTDICRGYLGRETFEVYRAALFLQHEAAAKALGGDLRECYPLQRECRYRWCWLSQIKIIAEWRETLQKLLVSYFSAYGSETMPNSRIAVVFQYGNVSDVIKNSFRESWHNGLRFKDHVLWYGYRLTPMAIDIGTPGLVEAGIAWISRATDRYCQSVKQWAEGQSRPNIRFDHILFPVDQPRMAFDVFSRGIRESYPDHVFNFAIESGKCVSLLPSDVVFLSHKRLDNFLGRLLYGRISSSSHISRLAYQKHRSRLQ